MTDKNQDKNQSKNRAEQAEEHDESVLNPEIKNESDLSKKERRLIEKEKLKGMGPKKKLEYIWMYYKPAIFDVLATGYWAARISEITEDDTVLIIGAGPTGICTLLCVMLKNPKRIIVCEKSPERIQFVREHYPDVLITEPETCQKFVLEHSDHGGADVVLEVAGSDDSFHLAWECARPNAIVTVVALYDKPQLLPLPNMYGKNLTFKTGGVDGCDCAEILHLIEEGKIDTTPLLTHRFPLNEIEKAYHIFENKLDGVIKIAITKVHPVF